MATTGTRERIIEAAAALLAEGGREAVSARAVSASAPYRPSVGDLALSGLARESVITTVTTDVPPYGSRETNTVSSAIALRPSRRRQRC
jgi:hypothetical protein